MADSAGSDLPAPTGADAAGTPVRDRRWVADAACCAALLAICLAIGLPRYRNGIDLGDEGFLAYGAERVLQGQLPNRDFVSLQPPLSFYTTAGAFWLLGTSLTAVRSLGLAIYLVIPLSIYAIARQRSRHLVSLVAAVPAAILGMPYFGFVPFACWHGALAALVATALAIRAATTGRTSLAVFAGLATTATILSRHDQGAYVVLSVLIYGLLLGLTGDPDVGRRARRMLRYWAVATLVPLSVLGVWWLAAGAIPSMFQQLVVFPLTTYAKTSSLPMPVFHPGMAVREMLVVSLYYLPPVVNALAVVWLAAIFVRRRAGIDDAHAAFLVVLSSLFYCQVLTRSDLNHLMMTFGPWFVVVAWSISALVKRIGIPALWAVPILAGAWVLATLTPVAIRYVDRPLDALGLPRAEVRIDAGDVAPIRAIVDLVQQVPADRAILSLPYSPMFYFLSARRNPTRWNYLWPGDQTPEDHRQLIEEAQMDLPGAVLLMDEPAMQEYAGAIVDYVRSSFTLVRDFGRLKIYVPNSQVIRPGGRE